MKYCCLICSAINITYTELNKNDSLFGYLV